ncbi:hypothetical protein [uncultured Desulfuromonas sp.]|uniref:hypothetical protein n=1 Tax=uncultured Desulfuromonas sp. TaxID=181013 RepID=UPI002AAC201D|nr:hypothetical protein [uncultured Desulfuromonas sp.]
MKIKTLFFLLFILAFFFVAQSFGNELDIQAGTISEITDSSITIGDRQFNLTDTTHYYRTSGKPALKDSFKTGVKILWSYDDKKNITQIGLIDSRQD